MGADTARGRAKPGFHSGGQRLGSYAVYECYHIVTTGALLICHHYYLDCDDLNVDNPLRTWTTRFVEEGNELVTAQVQIYCAKCKAKTHSRHIKGVTMKNGRPATKSICVDCGTRKFRIGALP